MAEITRVFSSLTLLDILDILVLTILIYNLLLLIKGTRAMQMITGIIVLLVAYYVATIVGLKAFKSFLEEVFFYFPFAVIVLFQRELRKALASFARNPFLPRHHAGEEMDAVVTAVVQAVQGLSSKSIGALIIFENQNSLKQYAETGVPLESRVSYDLLVNIFTPNTPLHDGAVIISEGRIAAAACFLPLSQDPSLEKEMGTRHRAAMGMTEENDAVAIVISEETGAIRFAMGGKLSRKMNEKGFKKVLQRLFVQSTRKTLWGLWKRES